MTDEKEKALWDEYTACVMGGDFYALSKFASRILFLYCKRRASLDRDNARQARRRTADVLPAIRAYVFERDGFRCRRCGNGPDDARLLIDHIVPIARGGAGNPGNLQTLCEPCNIGKADRAPSDHDRRAT